MKAKSKVLLGLIVALAMMVFAVPALAATFTVSDPTPADGVKAFVGDDKATFTFDITETDVQEGDTYSVAFTDKTQPTEELKKFTVDNITASDIELTNGKATVTVTIPGSEFTKAAKTETDPPDVEPGTVGEHTLGYTVTRTRGTATSVAAEKTCKVTVAEAPTVALKIGTKAATADLNGNVGDETELNVKGAESSANYQWQQSDEDEEADKADSEKWTAIDGQGTSEFTQKLTKAMDGKYVRCVVEVNGAKVVAKGGTEEVPVYCVKLNVNDTEKITVTVKETGEGTPAAKSEYVFFAGETPAASLNATAVGGSKEYDFAWYNGETKVAETAELTLTDKPITEDQAGTYKCVVTDKKAKDKDGKNLEGESDPIEIVVKKTPTLKVDKAVVAALAKVKPGEDGLEMDPATGGEGTVSVNKADLEKALSLTAVVDGEGTPAYYRWTNKAGKTVGDNTATLKLDKVDVDEEYTVTVQFEESNLPDLAFTVDFKETDGKLEGPTLVSNDAGATISENDVYKITLPAGLDFKKTTNPEDGKCSYATLIGDYGLTFTGEGAKLNNATFKNVKVVAATATAPATLTFEYDKLIGEAPLTNAVVGPMEITVSNMKAAEGTEDVPPTSINLPVDENVGYKILLVPTNDEVSLKGANDAGKVEKDYTGEAVEAEVKVDEGVGKATNIKYAKKIADDKYETATSEAPTESGTYKVTCDVEEGESYAEGSNLEAGEIVINPRAATKEDFVIDPVSKEYNGKEQTTDVTFAEGITGAGEIDEVTYKDQNDQPINPKEVGKYKVYVTTKGDFTNIQQVTSADPLYVGDFEITKVMPTPDLYTMNPTEVTYNEAEQGTNVTKADEEAGDVAKVLYYAEGSDEPLEGLPVNAGVYTVKIETKESDTYAAATGDDALNLGTFTIKEDKPERPTLYMAAHVQYQGWDKELTELSSDKPTADLGTTGRGWRVEAVDFYVPEEYQVIGFAHVQYNGDTAIEEVTPDYEAAKQAPKGYKVYRFGTTGEEKRVEAVCIGLQDKDGKYVDGFQYASHLAYKGWQGYVRNGSFSGSRGMELRMECLRFVYKADDIVPAGEPKDDVR